MIFLLSRQCVAYLTVICNNCNTMFKRVCLLLINISNKVY